MTLKELHEAVSGLVEMIENQGPVKLAGTEKGIGNIDVRIMLNELSIGGARSSGIKSLDLGFDWDAGTVLVIPKEDLVSRKFLKEKCESYGLKTVSHS